MAELMIGADPEFAIARAGRVVPATEFFSTGGSQVLGVDGGSILAEIRPRPSTNVIEVVESCVEIMQAADAVIGKEYEFYAGAKYSNCPIGGHIHCGGIKPQSEFVQPIVANMDFVSKLLTRTIEPVVDVRARRRTPYGRLTAWREQVHGFEYRTPLSWLVSPAIATLYLGLHKLAVVASFDEVHFEEIFKTQNPSVKVAKTFRANMKRIPEDCEYALDLLTFFCSLPKQNVLNYWHSDIRKNWRNDADLRELQQKLPAVVVGVDTQPATTIGTNNY